MPLAVVIDWTLIVVNLIAAVPAILATVFAYLIRRDIKTPSGAPIGSVAERGHNAAVIAANTAIAIHAKKPVDGDESAGLPERLEPKHG